MGNLRTAVVRAVGIGLVVAASATCAWAQMDPVKWSARAKAATVRPGGTFQVEATAEIAEGWHVYSVTQAPPPIATRVTVPAGQPFALAGPIDAPAPLTAFDQGFGIDTEFYADRASFTLTLKVAAEAAAGKTGARIQAYYQTCNDQFCLPPKTVMLEVPVEVAGAPLAASSPAPAAGGIASPDAPVPARIEAAGPPPGGQPAPVRGATPPAAPSPAQGSGSLWSFIWLAMSFGALSLLTPCVFPMVPITVSYFTNHAAGSRRTAVWQAVTYVLGIILTFTALGMAMALLLGATSLNRFAANPWINILITGIFVAFALSLFGLFDIGLPPALVNRLDALTRRQGGSRTLATLLMGLTFTLTSFTCTAPFIGTLLVTAATGDWQWPLVGMLAFSTVFALPFFVLAVVPQWMASLPKSGGWLNSVKVLMAFLEIAAAMKFLSNVDLVWGWGVFTHDVVLATWVAIFILMATYVLGLFRFAHDAPVKHAGVARFGVALACGAVAVWLATGLAGKPLGELEAFLPPPPDALKTGVTSEAGLNRLAWIMNDYPQALSRARAEGKRVFIDFTGYTCTNCRWMEAKMFPRDDVRRELESFVLVRLYTDGEGEIFQRQQRLQQDKYQTVALPFYAVVNADGSPVANFPGLTRDPATFVAFLKRAKS
jgi:thiol:disulfide interchange protein DsbD